VICLPTDAQRELTQQLARLSALSAPQDMQTKILIHRHLATSV